MARLPRSSNGVAGDVLGGQVDPEGAEPPRAGAARAGEHDRARSLAMPSVIEVFSPCRVQPVSVAHRLELQARRVGAVTRLGDADARDVLTAGDARQPGGLLLLGLALRTMMSLIRAVLMIEVAGVEVGPADLLGGDAGEHRGGRLTAVLLGDAEPGETHARPCPAACSRRTTPALSSDW